MRVDAWENWGEPRALSVQVGKSSNHPDPMRVEASKVVPGGVQLGSLDQLQGQQPAESGLYFMPSPVSANCLC